MFFSCLFYMHFSQIILILLILFLWCLGCMLSIFMVMFNRKREINQALKFLENMSKYVHFTNDLGLQFYDLFRYFAWILLKH